MKKLNFSGNQIKKAVRTAAVASALTCAANPLMAGPTENPTTGIWSNTGNNYTASGTSTSAYFGAGTASAYKVTVTSGSKLSSSSNNYIISLNGSGVGSTVTNRGSISLTFGGSISAAYAVAFINSSGTVNNTGSISSTSSATYAAGVGFGQSTGANMVINSGSITGTSSNTGGYGIGIFDSQQVGNFSLMNSGTITSFGVNQSIGVDVYSKGNILVQNNTGGSITANQTGVVDSAYGLVLSSLGSGESVTVNNAVGATISATGAQCYAIDYFNYNVGGIANFNNAGSITAHSTTSGAYGIYVYQPNGGVSTITNSGYIGGRAPSGSTGVGILDSFTNLTVNNTGTIFGSTYGISYPYNASQAAFTLNTSGGKIQGGSSYAVYVSSPVAPVVSVTGQTQFVSGAQYALFSKTATGNLKLNLVGGTSAQIATAQAAAKNLTGSFQFGSYTYSWENFKVTQLQLFSFESVGLQGESFESVGLPQYRDLERALDTRMLPEAYDPYLAQVAASTTQNATALSFLNSLSGFTVLEGIDRVEIEGKNSFQTTVQEQMESVGGVGGFSTANASIGNSSIAAVNSSNNQLDKLVVYAGSQMNQNLNGTEVSVPTVDPQRWDVWLLGNVTLGRQDSLTGSPGYNSVDGTPMAGADYAFTKDIKGGFLVGGTMDGANFSDGSRVNANTEVLGTYGTWNHGPWMADLVIAGGPTQYSDHRSTPTGTAQSSPDGYSFMTQANTGYTFNLGRNFTATPEVGVQYTHLGVDSYSETGASLFNTNVSSEDIDSLRTHLGGKVDGSFDLWPNMKLIPELRAAWYHECLDDSRGVATSLSSAPAFGSFNVNTTSPERDYATVGCGLNSVFTGFATMPVGMFLNYDAQVGQSSYIQHSITAGLKLTF